MTKEGERFNETEASKWCPIHYWGYLPNSANVLRVSSMSFPSSTPSIVTSPPMLVYWKSSAPAANTQFLKLEPTGRRGMKGAEEEGGRGSRAHRVVDL